MLIIFIAVLTILLGLSESEDYGNYTDIDNLFLSRYEELLKINKVTHYKVTKTLGVNINISRKWRAGTTPSLAVLTKLTNYFGVSIDYLIARNKQ